MLMKFSVALRQRVLGERKALALNKQLGNLVLSLKMLVSTKPSTLVISFCEDRTQSPYHLCGNSNS